MEGEEQLRSLLFLMTYVLLKRRRDINNANIQRRHEVQRRIRHRQYFFQRQRKMLMVVVSGKGHFWDVCASFPGGTDPSDILQNSSLWATASEGGLSPVPPPIFMGKPLRYMLLGEDCYPLQSWLMKAYPEERSRRAGHAALTVSQRLFNRQLRRALRVSEAALLRLRARWQCLSKRNDCGLDVVPTMILACCILHNMCESHGDASRAEWQEEVAKAESPQPRHKAHAAASMDQSHAEETRALFCDLFEQQSKMSGII
ncbi:unnamed protein product [Menidia menidia]|uniref:(Atlantic silverside) hypothetical protein n=1 Tax=Menidia menidia TaxID=238744 RepID=A0A8S4AF52_9TELE|nr:unnamed protein product [Menidia menidia]